MSTPVRVAAFVAGLAAVFAVAVGVGRAVGPIDSEPAEADHGHVSTPPASEAAEADGHADHGDGAAHGAGAAAEVPGGLAVSQGGYTLALAATRAPAAPDTPVSFTITGPDGEPVTAYDVVHEKRLHLVAVRRDATGFQHVHPELRPDGTWRTTLDLTPGPWRVFADFAPTGGEPLTLGADLDVAGDYRPAEPRHDSRTATVDGYEVTLEGDLAVGETTVLTPRVTRDGVDVTGELEPYLGALGHLVALRRGDLAYLHVHPEGLDFHTAVPSAGGYELFLDFKHDGVVRTAAFTLTAGEAHEHDH